MPRFASGAPPRCAEPSLAENTWAVLVSPILRRPFSIRAISTYREAGQYSSPPITPGNIVARTLYRCGKECGLQSIFGDGAPSSSRIRASNSRLNECAPATKGVREQADCHDRQRKNRTLFWSGSSSGVYPSIALLQNRFSIPCRRRASIWVQRIRGEPSLAAWRSRGSPSVAGLQGSSSTRSAVVAFSIYRRVSMNQSRPRRRRGQLSRKCARADSTIRNV